MMKIFGCHILFLLFIVSCSAPKQQGLVYVNDCESIKGWQDIQLTRWPVHSGWLSNKLDSIHLYGIQFRLAFKDISPKRLQKVKISLWVYFTEKSKSTLVIEIKDKYGLGLSWFGTKMEDQVKEIGKWQKITAEMPLQNPALNKPDNFITIYPWDNGKKDVYVDDLIIEFIPQR